jgi:hypothetical protein
MTTYVQTHNIKYFFIVLATSSDDGQRWQKHIKEKFYILPLNLLQLRALINYSCRDTEGRSQWQHGLRHEHSSPARILGSWIRIPLEAWMSVCVYSVFVLLCVEVEALRQADSPSKESYRLCLGLSN